MELGDTDSTTALFTDEEINSKLDNETNELLAAASLCDILATRFARAYDFTTDGQQFSRSQQSKAYAQRAKELRQQSGEGITSLPTTRVDGYSDDIAYDEVTGTASRRGRVVSGWYDPDLPY